MLALDCFREALGPPLDALGVEREFARLAGERESNAFSAAQARLTQLCQRLALRNSAAKREQALLALGLVLALYRKQLASELVTRGPGPEASRP